MAMNFKEYVESRRGEIYSKLCYYLPIRNPEGHYRMVREYVDRQGSYRRPGLLLLSSQMFGSERMDAILPAAAMQLSEDWLLIHDDIEDDSELRRGKPALQRMYGKELAINAGDAGHLAMWRIIFDYAINAGKRKGTNTYLKFYDMLEKTVEGQYIETNFIINVKRIGEATETLYETIAKAKSAYYSVYGPLQLGAIVAGVNNAGLVPLKRIGEPAGIAFQITDDILDMIGDEKTFGKKRYGDLYEGKITLMALHAYKNATNEERKRIDGIYSKRREQKTEAEIGWLADLMISKGSIAYAQSEAQRYGDMANAKIEEYKAKLPNNEFTDILFSAIPELYKRQK
jgi:geranylgeranyl diphosphate synthase type II